MRAMDGKLHTLRLEESTKSTGMHLRPSYLHYIKQFCMSANVENRLVSCTQR